jgi:uncharacterized protein (DUF305 family)
MIIARSGPSLSNGDNNQAGQIWRPFPVVPKNAGYLIARQTFESFRGLDFGRPRGENDRMMKLPLRPIAPVLSAVLAVLACSSASQGPVSTPPSPVSAPATAAPASGSSPTSAYPAATPSSPSSAAIEQGEVAAIARAKADSVRHPYTAADIDFMTHMIGHHAQAIVMARWAPTHGASPSVQTLAARIINAQQDEINIMQKWLRDRQLPVPEAKPMGMTMTMNGMQHEMLMPGMLTEQQMKQLDEARGPDFDRLFLSFMIQHHSGAVTMVKDLFGTYGAGQDETVFKFASDVNVDQTTEIARMQKLLASLVLGIPSQ